MCLFIYIPLYPYPTNRTRIRIALDSQYYWESNVILILVKLQASLAKSGNFLVTLVGVFVRLPLMIMVNTVLTRILVFVTLLKREDSEREGT